MKLCGEKVSKVYRTDYYVKKVGLVLGSVKIFSDSESVRLF
jgi:hypothetical protein